ncbi:MAG: AbrB/MazE/SpoVT family DNA-binding domain-containing protein [Desulfonatronovibrio sp.]
MNSVLTSKGQVTIPMEIRKRFALNTSDRVEFVVEDDRIILKPVQGLRSLRGSVSPKPEADSSQEYETAKKSVACRVMEEME